MSICPYLLQTGASLQAWYKGPGLAPEGVE